MNPTLLGVLINLGPSVVTATIAYLVLQRNIRAARPKTTAETHAIAGAEARAAVQQALDQLRVDLKDARARAREAEAASAGYRTEIAGLEKRLDAIESELTDAHEQNELLSKQLDTAQEAVKQLRKQNDLLLGYFAAYQKWEQRWYDAGHPEGIEKPPVININKLANP